MQRNMKRKILIINGLYVTSSFTKSSKKVKKPARVIFAMNFDHILAKESLIT